MLNFKITPLIATLLIFSTAIIAQDKQGLKSSPTKILFLGDSLTDGYGIPREQAYPSLIQKKLKAKHNIEITNAGISGSTSASAYLRLKKHLKGNYDILVLALGSNDGLRAVPAETTYKNLEKTIQLAQKNKLKILLLGARLPPNYGKSFDEKLQKVYTDLKSKYKVELMPFMLEDIAGKKELNQEDGIHPNKEGHKILARNILKYLEPML